jgi:hypothetical protein
LLVGWALILWPSVVVGLAWLVAMKVVGGGVVLFVEDGEVVQEAGDMKPASTVHSCPVTCRARRSSGEQNKLSEQRALTSCRVPSKGLISTAKKIKERGTHILPSTEQGNQQGSARSH